MALMKRHATAESEYLLGISVTADEQAALDVALYRGILRKI
jgi:hypothetical protein